MITLFLIALTTVLSTGIMCYVAIATPIGPWIAPTIALLYSFLFRFFVSQKKLSEHVAYIAATASVGGIIGIACGNSIPTLFFLEPLQWDSYVMQPTYFIALIGLVVITAGLLGLLIANIIGKGLIEDEKLPFPVGQLVYNIITVQQNAYKAVRLMYGALVALVIAIAQIPLNAGRALLAPVYMLMHGGALGPITLPALSIRLDALPMLLAIGFVSGSMIAIPLLVGAISKIFLVDPLNKILFSSINSADFGVAFASGMVVSSALFSVLDVPHFIRAARAAVRSLGRGSGEHSLKKMDLLLLMLLMMSCVGLWLIIPFPIFSIIYVMFASAVCSYQLAVLAGKMGLAPLGRFATFVVVPGMFLFRFNALQITLVSAFVEVAGGVAADLLFGRKIMYEMNLSQRRIRYVQLFALVVSACTVGAIIWLLTTRIGFGTELLPAQRAHARALLVAVKSFNFIVVACGALFGFLLRKFRLNPLLVFGGLLMPLNYSVLLIGGGLLPYIVKKPIEWEPFWSGMFAANSLCELVRALWLL